MASPQEQCPRISDDLVAELLGKRPDLQKFLDSLHDHFRFFSDLANSEFGVSAPTALMAQGADRALVYRAQLAVTQQTNPYQSTRLLLDGQQRLTSLSV